MDGPPPLGRAAALHALRGRDFRLLFSGQALSLVGDAAYLTALGWLGYRLTGSARALSEVLAVSAICMLATLLLGGVLADRYNRQRLMILSDLWRFLAVGALAVLAGTDMLTFPLLLVLAGVIGLGDGFFTPAFGGLVPLVVDAPMLGSANALIGFARWGGMIVGPAIAGGLYSVGGAQTVFAIDSVSFLASAGLVALARPRPAERAAQLGAFREIADGFRYVAGIPWLWVTISMASVSVMIAVAPFQALLPKLISTHFHQGVGALGTMTACFGLGTAAGALLFGQRGMRGRRVVVAYSCWGLANLVCAVSVLLPWFGAAAALAVGRGLLVGFALGIWETTLMELVPTDRLARVISLDYFGSLGLLPVGLIVAGLVSPLAAPGTLIAIGQSASGALLLLALLSRRMREI